MTRIYWNMKFELFISKRLKFEDESRKTASPSLNIAVIGIVLAIIIMILSITIVLGFKNEISNKIYNLDSHIKVFNVNMNTNMSENLNTVNANDIIPCLQNCSFHDSIATMSLIAEQPAIFKTANDFKGIVYKGVDANYNWDYIKKHLIKGRIPDMSGNADIYEITISKIMASQLNLDVNDRIYTYFIDEKVKVRRMTIVGIYSSDFEEYDQAYVLGNIKALQNINRWDEHTGTYVGIDSKYLDDIEEQAYSIFITLAKNTSDSNGRLLYNVSETNSNNVAYFSWLGLLDMNVVIIIILMSIVSAFTLVSALLMIVLERINLIGTLKSLGASSSSIRNIFIYLTQKLIFKSIIIGNAISLVLAFLQKEFHLIKLDAESYYMPYIPIEIDWGLIILLNIGIIILSYLTLIIPSMVVSSIKPSESIKFE